MADVRAAETAAAGSAGPAPVPAEAPPVHIHVTTDAAGHQTLHMGAVSAPVRRGPGALVPNVRFYDNPHHARIMQEMVRVCLPGLCARG